MLKYINNGLRLAEFTISQRGATNVFHSFCRQSSTKVIKQQKIVTIETGKHINNKILLQNHQDIKSLHEKSRDISHELTTALHSNLINSSPSSMSDNFYRFNGRINMKVTNLVVEFEKFINAEDKLDYLKNLPREDVISMMKFYGDRLKKSKQNRVNLQIIKQHWCQNIDLLDAKSLLLVADMIFRFDCDFISFMKYLVNSSVSRWKTLDYKPEEMTQLMFYMMVYGETSDQLMINVENLIVDNLHSFSLGQLNIICNGFFRVNRRIKSQELLDGIGEIVVNELNTMDLVQLTPFLKVFRHAGFHKISFFESVASHLSNSSHLKSETNLTRIMEIMRSYASLRIYNSKLFELTMEVFLKLLCYNNNVDSNIRSKDIAAYLWGYSLFSAELPKSTLNLVCENLRRCFNAGEFNSYPEGLVTALTALSYMNCFPTDLLHQLFSSTFLNRLTATRYMEKELQLVLLNSSLIIEHPEYKGFMLPKNFLQTCRRSQFGYLPLELSRRRGMNVLFTELKRLFGADDKIRCHFILPHVLTAGIEIHLDEENRPIPINYNHCHEDISAHTEWLLSVTGRRQGNNQKLVTISDSLIKNITNPDPVTRSVTTDVDENIHQSSEKRKIAIDIVGWHQVAFNDENLILANTRLKHRHLVKLGYELHVVTPSEGQRIEQLSTNEQLQKYVQQNFIDYYRINLSG